MKVGAVNGTRNNQSVSKSSYTSPNVFLKNNSMDTFELSTPKINNNKISFGKAVELLDRESGKVAEGIASLVTENGMRQIMEHFEALKESNPGEEKVIDLMKQFIKNIGDKVKVKPENKNSVVPRFFAWKTIDPDQPMTLNNMRYAIKNSIKGDREIFDYGIFHDTGERFAELIKVLDKYSDNKNFRGVFDLPLSNELDKNEENEARLLNGFYKLANHWAVDSSLQERLEEYMANNEKSGLFGDARQVIATFINKLNKDMDYRLTTGR